VLQAALRKRLPLLWVGLALLVILPPLLFPFAVMLSTSFKGPVEVYAQPPTFLPGTVVWQNFLEVWRRVALARYFGNSIVIGTGSAALSTVVAILAGYGVSRFRFPGRGAFLTALLISQMFSPIIVLLPLFRMFSSYHLLDSLVGLVLVNTAFNTPFAIWMLARYFDTVPKELEEAAQVDGATRVQSMMHVVVPLALPGMVATFIFVFMNAWNEFLFALSFVTTDAKMPVTTGLYSFVGHFKVEWNLLMGASLLAALPAVVLFMLIQRYMVTGLTSGAVK
jgi:multiple sugar transport system permease protein